MSRRHRKRIDPFAPPPADPAALADARREQGIADIPVGEWSAKLDGTVVRGTGGILTIGETEIRVEAAERNARRRTSETN